MKKTTENWLKIAEKDLKFAKLCLDAAEPLGEKTNPAYISIRRGFSGFEISRRYNSI
ncbi:MAG: hypothetical protein KGO93_03400 [Cyanobacteria bacterium REEB446]|nr:hypothetical protein [Cyanobacteria bacterium REEB446]